MQYPLKAGCAIHPPFSLWVDEATRRGQGPMAARVRRMMTSASCGTSILQHSAGKTAGCRSKGATISEPLVPNPLSLNSFFRMVRHLADWVAPFPHIQHSSPPPLKFLYTPSSPPHFLILTCTKVRGNHHHHIEYRAYIIINNYHESYL